MVHCDTYRQQLGATYPLFGHALWEPTVVEVGDVGCVRDGKFLRLFNALHPEDHESNVRFGVPPYHVPLHPRVTDHLDNGILKHSHYCSAGVNVSHELESLSTGPHEWTVTYTSRSKRGGAVLYLPVDAQRQDTLLRRDFGQWMIRHIDCWLAFARGLGMGIEQMEDITLVTGYHRSRCWASVTFLEGQVDSQATFKIKVEHSPAVGANVKYHFSTRDVRGAICSWGPEDDVTEHLSMFIRGFRIVRPLGILPRQLRAAAGPDPSLDEDPDFDWAFAELDLDDLSQSGDNERPRELIPPPTSAKYRDPLHVLSEYIAKQRPDCDMILVHDDDLARVDEICEGHGVGALQPDTMMGLLQGSKPELMQHVVRMWSSSSANSLETKTEATTVAMFSKEFQEWTEPLAVIQPSLTLSTWSHQETLLSPPAPSPRLHLKPVVFALVNCGNMGGYYVASHKTSMAWRNIPYDLACEIEDARQNDEEVEKVSIGLDGDWFLRTDARYACPRTEIGNISNVERFTQIVSQAGLSLAQYEIQFFTFMPDPAGYITVLHSADSSMTLCVWEHVQRDLDDILEREAHNGIRYVAVGKNGSFVVLLNTGKMMWSGIPEPLNQLLADAERRNRVVVTVSLSLISDSWYFVEFAGGVTRYFLPRAWHDSINTFTAQAERAQSTRPGSYDGRPLSLTHRPVGQYGPANPQSIPLAAIPYLPSQQAPVYDTAYNNPLPQVQQTSTLQDYTPRPMMTILGGSVKLVGAYLRPSQHSSGPGFGGF